MRAGEAVVDSQGADHAQRLMPLFEGYLEQGGASAGMDEDRYDHVRQGAVVFLGTLARHLDPADPKVGLFDSSCPFAGAAGLHASLSCGCGCQLRLRSVAQWFSGS
jgi:hypothetical protein